MLRSKQFLVVSVLVFLATACGSGGLGIGTGASVSLQQEWQLGDQMAQQVAQQMQLSRDAVVVGYLRQMGERIHSVTPEANLPFEFEVVNDPNVNAFSLPGGHIYINSGLIAQADHADMLAGVVAHEISHVIARHVIKQVEQQQAIGAIGSILLGQNPGVLQSLVAQILAGGAMARFSRADEKEADDLGLKYMTAAGYDPHGMLDMFQKLLSLEKGHPGAVERFFADHPMTDQRIKDIQNRINSMGRTSGIVDEPAYAAVKARVSG